MSIVWFPSVARLTWTLTPLFIGSEVKTNVTDSHTFSRALRQLHISTLCFDWFSGLFVFRDWPRLLLWLGFVRHPVRSCSAGQSVDQSMNTLFKVTSNLRGCPPEKNSCARCFHENPHKLYINGKFIKCRIWWNYVLFWILLSKGGRSRQLQNDRLTFQRINRVSNALVHAK